MTWRETRQHIWQDYTFRPPPPRGYHPYFVHFGPGLGTSPSILGCERVDAVVVVACVSSLCDEMREVHGAK